MTATEKLDKIHELHKQVLGAIAQYNLECEAAIASQTDADEAYKKGLDEAWEAARKIANAYCVGNGLKNEYGGAFMPYFDGENRLSGVFNGVTASEAIAKLRDYEARKKAEDEAVKVGDEVALLSEPGGKLIVTAIRGDGRYSGIITDGLVIGGLPPGSFRKTGRHFPEIAAVLEQMKGE